MRMLFIDVESLFGRFRVEELSNKRKIITEWRVLTLFADIIWVQAGRLVRAGQAQIANYECSLARELVQGGISLITLVDQSSALWDYGKHAFIYLLVNYLDFVAIVVNHFWVPLVLLFRICESVPDGKTSIVELDGIVGRMLVALPDAMRDRWD